MIMEVSRVPVFQDHELRKEEESDYITTVTTYIVL